MYQRLMYAIKRRILDESENAFLEHPAFSEKVKVYNKFPYNERVQFGLILRNASSSLIRLSADNFMSDLFSHVKVARQGTHPGIAIEWVRENEGNITEYIEEDVSSQLDPTIRIFTTNNPILAGPNNTDYATSQGQVLVTIDGVKEMPQFVYGENSEIWLQRAPSSGAVVKINYYHRVLVPPSVHIVEFTEDNEFIVGMIYVIEKETLIEDTTGTETTVSLDYGDIDTNSEEIWLSYRNGTRITVLEKGTDYSIVYSTGVITFLQPLMKHYRIDADYRYQPPGNVTGPYSFTEYQENHEAIPGIVIAIGRRAKKGDKQAVIVSQSNEMQAKIYGGHWEMSLDLAVIAKDPMQMEQMTDHIISYLWGKRKNVLEYEGIALNSVEPSGESEEVHVESTGDLYYESSVAISLQSEWQRFVPYNPIYRLRDIILTADLRPVIKGPILNFERLT